METHRPLLFAHINTSVGIFSIDKLKSEIEAGGLAPANKYLAQIFPPVAVGSFSRSLTVRCESAPMMGRAFATGEIGLWGPVRNYPYRTMYTNITLEFLLSSGWTERYLFDDWMGYISDTQEDNNTFEYPVNYVGSMYLIACNDAGVPQYGAEYHKLWPVQMSDLALSFSATEPARQSITFAYQKWTSLAGRTFDEVKGGLNNAQAGPLVGPMPQAAPTAE